MERDVMAKLPASVFKALAARAIERANKANSVENANDISVLKRAHDKTGYYYIPYKDAITSFLMAGYSAKKAEEHIKSWYEYDLVSIMFLDTYQLIGFDPESVGVI